VKLSDIKNTLYESSINRLRQHMDDSDSWAILTSWRAEQTKKDNQHNFKELTSLLSSKKLTYIKLTGVGQEKDPKTGKVITVNEPSLFIADISLSLAKKIMKKYDQFAIVYSGKETNGKIVLFSKDGNKNLGSMKAGKSDQFFSKIKNKAFSFS
jgi:hypothetical protein